MLTAVQDSLGNRADGSMETKCIAYLIIFSTAESMVLK